jgi:hypothetical protein
MQKALSDPPWLPLLNAMHRDWRDSEILKDHNPDPIIEARLREAGKWPIGKDTTRH